MKFLLKVNILSCLFRLLLLGCAVSLVVSCSYVSTSVEKDIKNTIDSLQQAADDYRLTNLDTMHLLTQEGLHLSEEQNYEIGILKGWMQNAIFYFYKGISDTSLLYLNQIEERLQNTSSVSLEMQQLEAQKNSLYGSIFHNTERYDSAAIYMYKAIQFFEKNGDSLHLAKVYANLATNYILTDDYEKALSFTEKSAVIFEDKQYKEGLTAIYERKGSIFAHQEKYDSALVYFQQSLELAKKTNHPFFIANGLHNLGSVYAKQQKEEQAFLYLNETLTLYQKLNNDLGYALSLNNLAEMYFKKEKNALAEQMYRELSRLSEKHDFWDLKIQSDAQLSKLYERKGAFREALLYLTASQVLEDSLKELKNTTIIKALESQYATREKDNELLAKQLALKQIENYSLLISLIAVLLSISLVSVFFYKKVENDKLKIKSEQAIQQQLELKHRTSNHLEQLSDLFAIYGLKNKHKKLITEAKNRVEAINLLYHFLSNSNANTINIRAFVEQMVTNILTIYGKTKTDIALEINVPSMELEANIAQSIGQVINEMLNNSLQYAFTDNTPKPCIKIMMAHQTGKTYQLSVSDNGKGFDTQKIADNSMGLMLIKTFIKSFGGQLTTLSDGNGTTHTIFFDL